MIATRLGVTRSAITHYLERYPALKKNVTEAEEAILDLAENKLQTKIDSGDMKAIKFFLETKGKRRGYVPRTEQEHTGIEPIQFNVVTQSIKEDTNAADTDNPDPETKPGDDIPTGQEHD